MTIKNVAYSLGTLNAPGPTVAQNLPFTVHKHTVQAVVTGAPATGSIQLEGTLDDVTGSPTWFNLSGAQPCTANTIFHVVDRPVSGIRVNLTALTGGTGPTVSIRYLGVQ